MCACSCRKVSVHAAHTDIVTWQALVRQRLARDRLGEVNAYMFTRGLDEALAGRHAEAAAETARVAALVPPHAGRGIRANVLLSRMQTLVEQGETGTPFEHCADEFARLGLGRATMPRVVRAGYVCVAAGRLAQVRAAATGAERARRLAAAGQAVRVLRRGAVGSLLTGHAMVAGADHAVLAGRPRRALRQLDALPAVIPTAPGLAFEELTVRARAAAGARPRDGRDAAGAHRALARPA
jgi:hypothetical protein